MNLKCDYVTDTTNVYFLPQQDEPKQVQIDISAIRSITNDDPEEEPNTDESDLEDDSPSEEDETEDEDDLINELSSDPPRLPSSEQVDIDENSLLTKDLHKAIDHEDDQQTSKVNNTDQSNEPVKQIFEFDIDIKDVEIPESADMVPYNKHSYFWYEAMDQEYMALIESNAWNLICPTGKERLLDAYFIYSLKSDDGIKVSRFKARYVINGHSVLEEDTHSPVLSIESLRTLLAWAVRNDLLIHTIDIKNAYLNSEMNADYYTKQPHFYVIPDRLNWICKLNKWSYGLPQSSKEWYKTLTTELKKMGYIQSKLDKCIFYSPTGQAVIFIYVDDIGIIAKYIQLVQKIKDEIREKFKLRDNGSIKNFLGISFDYQKENKLLLMSMKDKIHDLYNRNRDLLPKSTKVPLNDSVKLNVESPLAVDVYRYQSIVGSINFIATRTRPDLTPYINQLAKSMKSPTVHHEQLLFKLVAYLQRTINFCLQYDGSVGAGTVEVYSDSNYGDKEVTDGKSHTGTVVTYSGQPVAWYSKKQTVISADNCFSELYALNVSLKHGLAIRNLMAEIGLLNEQQKIIKIFADNKGSKYIAERSVGSGSKHYQLSVLYINDFIERKEVTIQAVKSEDNVADLFTKFVSNKLFYHFRSMMNMIDPTTRKSNRIRTNQLVTGNDSYDILDSSRDSISTDA